MTLLDAPSFNAARARKRRNIILSSIGVLIVLGIFVWIFWNWPAEHRVNRLFAALEQQQFEKAYGIWNDDDDWQQHADKYKDYPLQRFTEDWTTASPVGQPIHSHHVDISKTDGTGAFGSGIIVAVRVNGDHKLFMWYERKDGTLTEPAPHMLQYD